MITTCYGSLFIHWSVDFIGQAGSGLMQYHIQLCNSGTLQPFLQFQDFLNPLGSTDLNIDHVISMPTNPLAPLLVHLLTSLIAYICCLNLISTSDVY